MKNVFQKKFILLLVSIFFIPQVIFAAWWNPLTWKIFHRPAEVKIEKTITPPTEISSTVIETGQSKVDKQTVEIKKLKKEVEELKKKTSPAVSVPKPPIPSTISNTSNDRPKPRIRTVREQLESKYGKPNHSIVLEKKLIAETWEELEKKYFTEAIEKGWATLTVTNSLGEKRYYYLEKNGTWYRSKTENEMLDLAKATKNIVDYERSVNNTIDKFNQIGQMAKLQSNLERELFSSYKLNLSEHSIPLPSHYETYTQPTTPMYSGDIKIDPPKIISPTKWSVQWTGEGAGFIQDSSGQTTNFQCDSLRGRCFSL